jgi:hypothetical protein
LGALKKEKGHLILRYPHIQKKEQPSSSIALFGRAGDGRVAL